MGAPVGHCQATLVESDALLSKGFFAGDTSSGAVTAKESYALTYRFPTVHATESGFFVFYCYVPGRTLDIPRPLRDFPVKTHPLRQQSTKESAEFWRTEGKRRLLQRGAKV